MGREIELKLELAVDSAAARAWLGSEGETERLVATYYDTPKARLRERGVSFRVRQSAKGFMQTVKAATQGAAGLFDRAEWESRLPDGEPDFSLLSTAARDALDDPDDWIKLRPAFTVDVERTQRRIAVDGGEVELVLDIGRVQADAEEDRVAEFELELKAGTAAALFELARRLDAEVPVRLGVLTKAERGYRLAAGEAGRAAKAETIHLPREATTADVFAIIVRACLRHFRLNEPLASRRNAGGLHQARVALRRLRSALSLFRDVAADAAAERFRSRLRGLAALLGEARNLDVLLDRLGSTPADAGLAADLRREREAAYDRVIEELDKPDVRRLGLDLLEWSELGEWRTSPSREAADLLAMPAADFAAGVLDRYRRRVKKRGAGLTTLEPEPRHRVRIEAKKLRYASEFFASLFEGGKSERRTRSFLSALEDLQAELGTLNDIATGHELAEGLAAKGIRLPATVGGEDEAKLLKRAEAAHERLVEAKRFWR